MKFFNLKLKALENLFILNFYKIGFKFDNFFLLIIERKIME